MKDKMRRLLFGHISSKIMLGTAVLLLIAVICFIGLLTIVNSTLSDKLKNELDHRLESDIRIVQSELERIEGNKLEIDGTDSPLYQETREAMDRLKVLYNLENVYILSNDGGTERIIALSDTEGDYNLEYLFSDEMKQAITNDQETISSIYKDEFGVHKSMFVPLKNENGTTAGLLGIDLDASVIPETASAVLS